MCILFGMKTFNLGDMVIWKSQSRGSTVEKIGKIVWLLHLERPLYGITPCRIADSQFPHHQRMFDGLISTATEKHPQAYFVEVTQGNRKPKLYMPRPQHLRLWKSAKTR